jgi:protein SCO1/2
VSGVASRRILRVAGVLLVLALAGACGSTGTGGNGVVSGVTTSDHDGYAGALLPTPYAVPAVTLRDTSDRPFSMTRDTAGKLSVVFFGYTKCPDTCQIVMGTIASAYARLAPSEKSRVQVLFVTTDPARDTGKVLRTYLDRLNPAFVGLTGSLATIDTVGKPLGIFIKKGQKLPSGGYEVTHTTSIIAVGAHRTAPLVWSATISPSELASDIHTLLKKKV